MYPMMVTPGKPKGLMMMGSNLPACDSGQTYLLVQHSSCLGYAGTCRCLVRPAATAGDGRARARAAAAARALPAGQLSQDRATAKAWAARPRAQSVTDRSSSDSEAWPLSVSV